MCSSFRVSRALTGPAASELQQSMDRQLAETSARYDDRLDVLAAAISIANESRRDYRSLLKSFHKLLAGGCLAAERRKCDFVMDRPLHTSKFMPESLRLRRAV